MSEVDYFAIPTAIVETRIRAIPEIQEVLEDGGELYYLTLPGHVGDGRGGKSGNKLVKRCRKLVARLVEKQLDSADFWEDALPIDVMQLPLDEFADEDFHGEVLHVLIGLLRRSTLEKFDVQQIEHWLTELALGLGHSVDVPLVNIELAGRISTQVDTLPPEILH